MAKKASSYDEELEALKARQRFDIIKVAGSIVVILLVIWWDAFYGQPMIGDNANLGMIKSAIIWIIAIILAGVAGLSSRDYGRARQEIANLNARQAKKKKR